MSNLKDFISNALVFRDTLHKVLSEPFYYRWVFFSLQELLAATFVIAIGDTEKIKKNEYVFYTEKQTIRFLNNFISEKEPFQIIGNTVFIDRKFNYDCKTRSAIKNQLADLGLDIQDDRLQKIINRKLQKRQNLEDLYLATKFTIKHNKLIFKPKHDQAIKELLTITNTFRYNHPDRWQIDQLKLFEVINPCLEIIFRIINNNAIFKKYTQENNSYFQGYSRKLMGKVKHDLNVFYKILWESSIIEKFGKVNYQPKKPPQPDFLIDQKYYIEVTSATYNQDLAKQIHLLNKSELSAREFNAANIQLTNPDEQLESFLFHKIESKKSKYYRTYNKPVSLLVYLSAPITKIKTIEKIIKSKKGYDKGQFEHIWIITANSKVWELK